MEQGDKTYQLPDAVEIIFPQTAVTLDDFLFGLTLGYDERPQVNESGESQAV